MKTKTLYIGQTFYEYDTTCGSEIGREEAEVVFDDEALAIEWQSRYPRARIYTKLVLNEITKKKLRD